METWIKNLGYDKTFYKDHSANIDPQKIARVTAEHKGSYQIIAKDGEHVAVITGKRMLLATKRDDYPAVGDWVNIKESSDDTKIIEEILPRKTVLHKKYGGKKTPQLIAANVDVAFIVESISRDYSLNRFERYIVLAREGAIEPVIIINKSDLANEVTMQIIISQIQSRFGSVDVISTSSVTDEGLDFLTHYIRARLTYCFLGSSGVGKSSIINKLLDKECITTKSIGIKTGRGKHTTTARQMYFMANGGIIIDNPGCREVGITNNSSGIKKAYKNIEDFAGNCKFKDCSHTNEPGCAVLYALNVGKIDQMQYQNYQKLYKETKYYELDSYGKRQKNKEFGKFIKNAKKDIDKFDI